MEDGTFKMLPFQVENSQFLSLVKSGEPLILKKGMSFLATNSPSAPSIYRACLGRVILHESEI